MIRLRQGFRLRRAYGGQVGRQARRREDRGALEFAVLVLFCVIVELACLIAWMFG